MSGDTAIRSSLLPISTFRVQNLSIVAEEPLPALVVAPEDRILSSVELQLPIPGLLLLAVGDVQDVLVLARLSLDEARARHADLLVAFQGSGQINVLGEDLAQRRRVLERLRCALR